MSPYHLDRNPFSMPRRAAFSTPTRAQDSQSPDGEYGGSDPGRVRSGPAPDVAAAIDELPEPLHDLGVDSGRQHE